MIDKPYIDKGMYGQGYMFIGVKDIVKSSNKTTFSIYPKQNKNLYLLFICQAGTDSGKKN